MTLVLEGSWEEIKTHDAELAGKMVRLVVDQPDLDYSEILSPPPNSITSVSQLERLLLERLTDDEVPVTADDWASIRQQCRDSVGSQSDLKA